MNQNLFIQKDCKQEIKTGECQLVVSRSSDFSSIAQVCFLHCGGGL